MSTTRAVNIFLLASYLYIGLLLWHSGGGWNAPDLYANIFTFRYAVFLWPLMMGLFVLFH